MADSTPKDRVELNAVPASKEPGVTEAIDLYMRAEEIYVAANAFLTKPQVTRTSNSTNSG